MIEDISRRKGHGSNSIIIIMMSSLLFSFFKVSSSFSCYNNKISYLRRYSRRTDYVMAQKRLSSTSLSSRTSTSSTTSSSDDEETLFALSSGGGGASATAVAVIRITGPESHDALKILLSKTNEMTYEHIKLPKPRYASLRMLYDPPSSHLSAQLLQPTNHEKIRDPLDSSLILLFNKPSSFTGQDMVEIHSHGSRAVVQGVLSALSRLSDPPYNLNIRPADRGEFTQRAYGSGKLGLVEVEALADLIVADTSYQRLQALRQLDGRLSRLYEGWREELVKGLAHAEAVIDFGDDEDLDDEGVGSGDDDEGQMNVWGAIRPRMEQLRMKMERHLADSQRGEILRDGVRVAICGPPNAGKSSLLNLLANREAAIVSPIAGTTRDVIEVTLDLGGVRCIVSDTAGVRDDASTGDIIEVEGIKRARKVAGDAHVLVAMVDASDPENGTSAIKEVIDIEKSNGQQVLLIYNKIDLLDSVAVSSASSRRESLEKIFSEAESYEISCEDNTGVDNFFKSLTEKVISRVVTNNEDDDDKAIEDDDTVITRARHRRHVMKASQALYQFHMRSGEGYMALDLAAEELRLAASELGRITGAVDVEDVLDVLFSDFCIGK